MIRKLLAAGALALAFGGAQAALVTVNGNIGFSEATGTGGFQTDVIGDEHGLFTFTYNTSLPDSDPNPNRGLYVNPFTAFRMTIDQYTRPPLEFVLSGPSRATSEINFPDNGDLADTYYRFSVQLRDLSGAIAGDVQLRFVFYRRDDLETEAIVGVNEWRSLSGGSASVWTLDERLVAAELDAIGISETFVVSVVPAPAPLSLLAGGVLAAGIFRRRIGAGRRP